VKLYADEPGHATVRRLRSLIVSAIARVEVPAALWRKERLGELQSADAEVLVAAFAADYDGADREAPLFAAVALTPAVLETAAQVTAAHALRAYDAVQLASALAARDADPGCTAFACLDDELRAAAARSGFGLVPG
jgi:predicted nucleic acid-binding protein